MANYLYNGIELPALPEWDKETYPYAYITNDGSLYCFWYEATAKNVGDGGYMTSFSTTRMYLLKDGVWEKTVTYGGGYLLWSNADTYYAEGDAIDEELWGTLYLAASDPIPVTSAPAPDAASMLMGWLVGRAIAGQRA